MPTTDLKALVPARVIVTFPKQVDGALTGTNDLVTVYLATLALPEFGTVPGYDGSQSFHCSAISDWTGSTWNNQTVIEDLAEQIAKDWYRWQLGSIDLLAPGIVHWIPGAMEESITWTVTATSAEPTVRTRVQRPPLPDRTEFLYHASEAVTEAAAELELTGVENYVARWLPRDDSKVLLAYVQHGNGTSQRTIQSLILVEPYEGTFDLVAAGGTAAAVPADVNASGLQSAINTALTVIIPPPVVTVTVTGSGTAEDPFLIEYFTDDGGEIYYDWDLPTAVTTNLVCLTHELWIGTAKDDNTTFKFLRRIALTPMTDLNEENANFFVVETSNTSSTAINQIPNGSTFTPGRKVQIQLNADCWFRFSDPTASPLGLAWNRLMLKKGPPALSSSLAEVVLFRKGTLLTCIYTDDASGSPYTPCGGWMVTYSSRSIPFLDDGEAHTPGALGIAGAAMLLGSPAYFAESVNFYTELHQFWSRGRVNMPCFDGLERVNVGVNSFPAYNTNNDFNFLDVRTTVNTKNLPINIMVLQGSGPQNAGAFEIKGIAGGVNNHLLFMSASSRGIAGQYYLLKHMSPDAPEGDRLFLPGEQDMMLGPPLFNGSCGCVMIYRSVNGGMFGASEMAWCVIANTKPPGVTGTIGVGATVIDGVVVSLGTSVSGSGSGSLNPILSGNGVVVVYPITGTGTGSLNPILTGNSNQIAVISGNGVGSLNPILTGNASATSTPPAFHLRDLFTDTDTTALGSHTMDVGPGWTASPGSWQINSNKTSCTTSSATYNFALADAVAAGPGRVKVTITSPATGNINAAVVGWAIDTNTYWAASLYNGYIFLQENGADVASGAYTYTANTDYVFELVWDGTDFTVYLDGVLKLTWTPTSPTLGTLFGLRDHQLSVSPVGVAKFDNFNAGDATSAISGTGSGSLSLTLTGDADANEGGPIAWYAADSIVGLSDGDPVDTWPDDSVNGVDGVAGGGITAPTWHSNVINGLPVVRFDGTNDVVSVDGSYLEHNNLTILIVAKHSGDSPGPYNYSGVIGGADTNSWGLCVWDSGATDANKAFLTKIGVSNTGPSTTAWAAADGFVLLAMHYDGADMDIYRNGTADGTSSYTETFSGGANYQIGAMNRQNGFCFNGDIAEIIVFDSAIPNLSYWTTYLMTKYGL